MAHNPEKSVYKGCRFKCGKLWFLTIASWSCFSSLGCALFFFFFIGFLDRLSLCGHNVATGAAGLKSSNYREISSFNNRILLSGLINASLS